jgi:hypothetical protein
MMKFISNPNHVRPHPTGGTDGGERRVSQFGSEHGGARLTLLVMLLVIATAIYGITTYAPVAYKAAEYKDLMQSKVDQAAAFGYTGEWVGSQLRATSAEYDIPPNAVITAMQKDGRLEATVRYSRPVMLPGYTYNYEFDHSVRSSNFLVTSR